MQGFPPMTAGLWVIRSICMTILLNSSIGVQARLQSPSIVSPIFGGADRSLLPSPNRTPSGVAAAGLGTTGPVECDRQEVRACQHADPTPRVEGPGEPGPVLPRGYWAEQAGKV